MKLSSRSRRWLLIATGTVAAYALLGFFVAPFVARGLIEQRASAALHRTVKIAKVRMNPFAMSVAIEGLTVADRDGAELASWTRAYANFDPLTSLFRQEWHLGELALVQPRQRLEIGKDGTLNIADLLPPTPAPEPRKESAALPSVGVGLLRVENGAVVFTDRSRRTEFHTVAGPMTFELRGFTTRPDAPAPYSLAGTSDTIEKFAWSGSISAVPLGSKGLIDIRNISLPGLKTFAEDRFAGEITSGRASAVVDYEITLSGTPVLRLKDSTFTIDDLALATRGAAEPGVAWKQLEVRLTAADLLARTADVARVALTGLEVQAERLADGSIDLLGLLPARSDAAPSDANGDTGPAPSVRVAEIALIDGRVRATDRTTPRAGVFTLDQIQVTLKNAGTDLDREIHIEASLRTPEDGSVTAKGVARVLPFAARCDVQVAGFDLRPFEPWIEPMANLKIAGGKLDARGHLEAGQPPRGKLALTWTGESGINGLAIRDGKAGGELLAWQSLALTGTRFNLDPLEVAAAEIVLTAPIARVVRDETGALNFAAMVPPATATPAAAPAPLPTAATAVPEKTSAALAVATRRSLPFAAKVDAITITGGRLSFADRSVPGAFTTEIRDFGGSIRGLSSAELARADVDLSGSLDGVAPLHIKGSINPLANDRFSDVTVTFSNIDLPLFTPYGGKFIGKKIQKGKLRVELTYKLSQNTLEAENHVMLDQFFLGEPVASPDALKLPIGLALALLRDREGKIILEIPVRGNLDDPDFKYGRVVMQVLGNVIVKAATAPFAMLGGLFGGKKEDLSYVDFASGSAEFLEATTSKLDTLGKALYERPALRLEISAPSAPDGDRAGLREKRLAEMLRAEKGTPPAAGEADAALTPDEIESLVRSLFARQFPAEATAAMAATGSLPPPTSDEGPKKSGLLQRLAGSIFRRKPDATPAPTSSPTEPTPASETPPPLTLADMRTRLLESIALTDADFQELAAARARAIRDRLVTAGKIEPERVFLVNEPRVPEGANSASAGGRVFFGLE